MVYACMQVKAILGINTFNKNSLFGVENSLFLILFSSFML